MAPSAERLKIAILDDYMRIALKYADWSGIRAVASVEVFDRNLSVPDEAAQALAPFHILCAMRERMPMPRALLERLPNLRYIALTGVGHRLLDLTAATDLGILVSHSIAFAQDPYATGEMSWALTLAAARNLVLEDRKTRGGGWQNSVGMMLHGKTLGLIGLGVIGSVVAGYGKAFGMRVIAWTENMTPERAKAADAEMVEKDELFRASDVIHVHVVLGDRTRRLITAREIGLMKPTAYLINTARGPIIDESALIEALRNKRIAGAGLDVFEQEPLPCHHPLLELDNVVLSPHMGYTTTEIMTGFHGDTVEAVSAFLAGKPIRVLNPQVKRRTMPS